MKRIGNLYEKIYSVSNLWLADKKARKGKSKQNGVIQHDKNRVKNIFLLHKMLKNKTYKTSEYTVFKIFEEKEREISMLPYKDRIVHHAVLNILEPIFVSTFTADTYNCIKGRGVHKALYKLKAALKNKQETTYCLKLDIKQFYPSVSNEILKQKLRRKFKDRDLLYLLDNIVDSTNGLPLGNYTSQFFANFYLSDFDHWIKQENKIKYYFRYCDDIVILHCEKTYLHYLFREIKDYLTANHKLEIKSNWQVFPVAIRGIDFLGYKSFPDYTLMRKRIKKRFSKKMKYRYNTLSEASYMGIASHGDCRNLIKKICKQKRYMKPVVR